MLVFLQSKTSLLKNSNSVIQPAPNLLGKGNEQSTLIMHYVWREELLTLYTTGSLQTNMATPILVVDDSPMARKMLIKSLPSSWDVDITQAGNGEEAIAAYRAGKADVMFLDLTMPVMDGYGVLETLQKEGLNSFVIVVSADIQPIAAERVKKLGAIAFVKKPVNPDAIVEVLRQYGVTL